MEEAPTQLAQIGPKLFFKYQQINKYTLQNLVDNQLWMSQISAFNDPFEFQYHILQDEPLSNEQKDNFEMMEQCGVVCLSTHPKLKANPDLDDNQIHPDNMLMWSHYANNHYGFCLGLRKKAIIYAVKYSDEFPIIDLESELQLEIQLFVALHTKQNCWSYENEYRMLNTGIQNDGIPCEDTFEIEYVEM